MTDRCNECIKHVDRRYSEGERGGGCHTTQLCQVRASPWRSRHERGDARSAEYTHLEHTVQLRLWISTSILSRKLTRTASMTWDQSCHDEKWANSRCP